MRVKAAVFQHKPASQCQQYQHYGEISCFITTAPLHQKLLCRQLTDRREKNPHNVKNITVRFNNSDDKKNIRKKLKSICSSFSCFTDPNSEVIMFNVNNTKMRLNAAVCQHKPASQRKLYQYQGEMTCFNFCAFKTIVQIARRHRGEQND